MIKYYNFISNNKFEITDKDPTDKYQKPSRQSINGYKSIIPKDMNWNFTNFNPTAPTIRGLIKTHQTGHPKRHIVNRTNAPA
jgi:hypothetical protein